ncbi:MAG: alkaline phosphatase, partial [Rhodoferax sp.]
MTTRLQSRFKLSALGVALGLALAACGGSDAPATLTGVEFTDTPVPSAEADMLKTQSSSKAVLKYSDGTSKEYPLSYTTLFK